MFSLIVLFTVFLGLLGILAVYDQCQKRLGWRRSGRNNHDIAQLIAWLEERGHTLPSSDMVIELLNRVIKKEIRSEDWLDLRVTGLLPGTELPHFKRLKIKQQTTQHIDLQVGIEWPMCLPGVGVSLIRKRETEEKREDEGGEEVMCELQVDWMYAEADIRLSDMNGLMMGYKHTTTPQMALSCLVTTEGIMLSEEVASSVAHALQLMFCQLELSNEQLKIENEKKSSYNIPQTTVSTNHVPHVIPLITINHNHIPSQSIIHHDNKPHPSTDSPSSDTTPLSTTHSSTSQTVNGEEGGGEGNEGEKVAIEAPVFKDCVLVSRKVWARESVTVEEDGKVGSVGRYGGDDNDDEEVVNEKRECVGEGQENGVQDINKKLSHDHDGLKMLPLTSSTTFDPRSTLTDDVFHDNNNDVTTAPPTHKHSTNYTPPSPLTTHKQTTPSSPVAMAQQSNSTSSWRRSPSYEKLKELALPSVKEGGPVTEEVTEEDGHQPLTQNKVVLRIVSAWGEEGRETAAMSLDRRKRHRLSMSGSAYSVESGDRGGFDSSRAYRGGGDSSRAFEEEMYPSLLVFEITDSIRTRHIVALSPAHASKLRKRITHAKKLHIYNDHIFMATHLKQRFYCNVCKGKIIGFVGKQAYACRDCNMVVHKRCHYKTEGLCTNSKVSSMNLIYPDSVSTISGL